ncbi:hotdog fold domain-containing protein [Hahella ganghwensis]|uniref:hotdog fold domain-containing protein n=1 Tax=Hahella ganghwensis TaxID=286420 RepID=UPI00037A46FE|nr:hotdog fold domain-containing protein [Hahella ganghwensis]
MSQAAVYSQDFIPPLVRLYNRMNRWPMGQYLFAKALCFKAPYFSSIKPAIETLKPGKVVWKIRNRRGVHNHLGTVHALAMGNLAELCAGTAMEVSLPTHLRWIPKGMNIEYLKKATTDLTGICDLRQTDFQPGDCHVIVDIKNTDGESVVRANINMWLSEKRL